MIHRSFRAWYAEQQLDAVVLDIDGVLMRNGRALPGAAALLRDLRNAGIPFSVITNSADISIPERHRSLAAEGLDIGGCLITSSGHPLVGYVNEHGLRGSLFFMIARLGDPCYAEAAGVTITRDPARLTECSGVIVGEGECDWQDTINAVVNYFRWNRGAYCICPNPDMYFPEEGDSIRIASGGVTKLIFDILSACGSGDIKPVYLGKPYHAIFGYNHRRMESRAGHSIRAERTMMLGDMLDADILGANSFGYRTALLLTGGTTEEMLSKGTPRPELVFRNL